MLEVPTTDMQAFAPPARRVTLAVLDPLGTKGGRRQRFLK